MCIRDRLYGVATLNFLLDGGDSYKVARNAEEVIMGNGYLYDTMLAYVQGLTAAGKPIEYQNQNWITILEVGAGLLTLENDSSIIKV